MALKPPDRRSLEGTLRAWALEYPDATEDFPWGERAIKVRGKVFLFLRGEAGSVSFSVKLRDSAAEALELSYVEPTHYGLGKHGWVTAVVDAGRDAPLDLFRSWLEESFRAVAPKRVVAQLDARGASDLDGASSRAKGTRAQKPTRPRVASPKAARPKVARRKAARVKRSPPAN